MADKLNVSAASVQFTLAVFFISYGVCQLIIGGILDSYGRHRLTIASLFLFSVASFVIAFSKSIELIYCMRVIHGITVATIVVAKRAYFVDVYSGERLKHYTSLFSIIWSASPIIAPFLGGYLQTAFGWQFDFIFIGFFGLLMLVLELIFSGETLKIFQPFHFGSIAQTYSSMLCTKDFIVGIAILGLSFSMLMLYAMACPFLIENVLHFSPKVTGTCSLISGIALLAGGLLSKALMRKPFFKKIFTAIVLQVLATVFLTLLTIEYSNLYTLLAYVIILHALSGFVFNNLLSHCLIRFPNNAGKTSGLVGGGMAVFNAVFSYGLVNLLDIKSQPILGVGYLVLAVIIMLLFVSTKWNKQSSSHTVIQLQQPIVLKAKQQTCRS
jgi:MFS family permease